MLQQEIQFSAFRNDALFADHYLSQVLPGQGELWRLEGLAEVRARLQQLWQQQAQYVAGYNEKQLEVNFIRPVLAILGHVFEVEVPVGDHQPDYGFFADEEARHEARGERKGSAEFWRHALAVGDAKYWDRRLDKPLSGGSGWDFQNPEFQIYHYLAETGCRWAILTNGRKWRLYSGHPGPKLGVFYEVDLPALLQAGRAEDLAYFWLFFRKAAFLAGADGASFLERVQAESAFAAEKLREDLRQRAYPALRALCRGFAEGEGEDLDEGRLKAIYDNALVVLYRLLFILYAEAEELLPLRGNDAYREQFSLRTLEQGVHDKRESFRFPTRRLWLRLRELFQLIDRGPDYADLGVPAYNGGLFDPEGHPFLEAHSLSDRHAAEVLELLTRSDAGTLFDYRDLGVRHLGSIYEGLLEFSLAQADRPMGVVRRKDQDLWVPLEDAGEEPQETCEPGDLYLVTDRGERKTSGSYYTPQFIVDRIVRGTLEPLVEQCGSAEEILSLDVLDPAMGSGHFLVTATDYLAGELVRLGNVPDVAGETDEAEITAARRLVVERCIYGVDLNPLAVELAKLSLWLNTVAEGQPLSFLDHHLRVGNSLVGTEVERMPVPPDATAEAGEGQSAFDEESFSRARDELVTGIDELTELPSASREDVHEKERRLQAIEETLRGPYTRIADLWCSHYFGNEFSIGMYNHLAHRFQGTGTGEVWSGEPEAVERSRQLAERYRFFHWELEFPEVFFEADGSPKADPGFDAVIGNPPWERIKLQDIEFFGRRAPEIALAPTAVRRKQMIERLEQSRPELWQEYLQAREQAERLLAWTRKSGQFPLMGRGDTNLYAVMIERGRSLLCERGRLGFVVPSGIATDKTTSGFFGDLVERRSLQSLLDFENRRRHFRDVDSRFKYSIVVLSGGEPQEQIECGFFLHGPEDIEAPERVFTLNAEDFALFNPNTLTCPVFRTRRDAELTRAIYRAAPVLVRHTDEGEENPWGVRYLRMFDMTNDSDLFRTAAELEADGFYPVAGNRWQRAEVVFVPLYVGKMVRPYDHRAASVEYHRDNPHNPYVPRVMEAREKGDPAALPIPQFWVPAGETARRLTSPPPWVLAFRDIARATDERTMIAAAAPPVGFGNKLPLLLPVTNAMPLACLLGNLNASVFDFAVRQKIGSTSLNWYIVEQLPVLPPERYEEEFGGVRLADFVGERVLELTYTAHDMAGFAEDMGYVDEKGDVLPPFAWDEERRLHLRCQLDALYFHLYGLGREDAAFILDTFPIVREHDLRDFGGYRTKDLILHYYNAYAAGDMEAWVKG